MQDIIGEIRIYILGVWQRRWLGISICWLVGLIGAYSVYTMPDQYVSSARIYVDTDSAVTNVTSDLTVRNDIEEEIRVRIRTLLSRPNLEQVARLTDLDLDVNTNLEREALIDSLNARSTVRSEGNGLILIQFEDQNPVLARDVVQALVNIFIESNKGESRGDVGKARVFLDSEIESYERKLSESEGRLSEFRGEYAYVIGKTNYAQRLQEAEDTVAEATVEYTDALGLRDQLSAQLAETPRFITIGSTSENGEQSGPTTTLGRIRLLQSELDNLLLTYTENHPDVVRTRRQINRLVAIYNSGSRSATDNDLLNKSSIPNQVYDQIQLKLVEAETGLSKSNRRLEKAQAQLARLQEHAQIAPSIDAELSKRLLAYNTVNKTYQDLLERRETLILTQQIETKTSRVDFRRIEPPEVPASPDGPVRPLFLGVVFVLAIGAGGAGALVRSQLEETFFEPSRLENSIGLTVLGTVTQVPSEQERANQRFSNYGFALASGSFVFVFALMVAASVFFGTSSESLDVAGLI